MSKNHITIAKPDASRSCHHCRHSDLPFTSNDGVVGCDVFGSDVNMTAANGCSHYRDTRRTSQVISASGKVFD